MEWHPKLYCEEGLQKKLRRIRTKTERGKWLPGIYLLTLSQNPHHLLEIVSSAVLCQKSVRERTPLIVGVADGKDGAVELAGRLLLDAYRETGAFSVEKYLRGR